MNNTINDLGRADRIPPRPRRRSTTPTATEFNYFMGANMAMRREAILAAGGFDETYTVPL